MNGDDSRDEKVGQGDLAGGKWQLMISKSIDTWRNFLGLFCKPDAIIPTVHKVLNFS